MTSPHSLPLTGVRGMIAAKMQASLREAAQITYCAEADATNLIDRRRSLREETGASIGYEDIIAHTLARTLAEHPLLNGLSKEKTAELSSSVHISIAVALETGLVAPTVFDVQDKSVEAVCAARRDLLRRAAAGRLTVREMTGGTFTISNLGLTRVRFFTPILNTPQIAMLGLGRIETRPAVVDGAVVPRPMMGLSLTADHRIVDGDPAGRFLTAACHALETL